MDKPMDCSKMLSFWSFTTRTATALWTATAFSLISLVIFLAFLAPASARSPSGTGAPNFFGIRSYNEHESTAKNQLIPLLNNIAPAQVVVSTTAGDPDGFLEVAIKFYSPYNYSSKFFKVDPSNNIITGASKVVDGYMYSRSIEDISPEATSKKDISWNKYSAKPSSNPTSPALLASIASSYNLEAQSLFSQSAANISTALTKANAQVKFVGSDIVLTLPATEVSGSTSYFTYEVSNNKINSIVSSNSESSRIFTTLISYDSNVGRTSTPKHFTNTSIL